MEPSKLQFISPLLIQTKSAFQGMEVLKNCNYLGGLAQSYTPKAMKQAVLQK